VVWLGLGQLMIMLAVYAIIEQDTAFTMHLHAVRSMSTRSRRGQQRIINKLMIANPASMHREHLP
jgi:hypothetical protein